MNDRGAPGLILASTSRYRRELLSRLTPGFDVVAPRVTEDAGYGEAPALLAQRLAREKAHDVADRHPGMLVIGSDQVAELDGLAIGKPGSADAACAQLAACSGRELLFHTAVCLVDARGAEARVQCAADLTRVVFRMLDADEIARYVAAEQPLDCAGSFKAEGLGITLFERIESIDPTALVGLPLIALAHMLRAAGLALP
jgi:septum formation protein